MSYYDAKTEYRPIAEIVQEATNGGQLIVEFLVDTVLGKIEGVNHWHRLEATRQLQRLGLQLPNAVKQAVSTPANGTTPSASSAKPRHDDELADIIREETHGGRDIVRFLIDAMQGKLEGFKARHRLAASDRLITRGFDIAPDHSEKVYQGKDNKESCSESCYHWAYAVKRWAIDGHNRKALEQLYGSEEAASVAIRAAVQLRRNTVRLHSHVPDHDFTPIDNPEDDPHGKGSYGYEILFDSFGDNQAVRVANRAVEKYKKRLAEDAPVGAGFKPDRDPAQPSAEHNSGPQQDLPENADSKPVPESEHPNDTTVGEDVEPSPEYPRCQCRDCSETVGEGLRPSRDPQHVIPSDAEGSPAPALPSSSASPDHPPAEHDSEHPIDTTVEEDFGPFPKYEYCQDCSKMELKGFQPSRDPPHDTLNGAEGPPAPKPPPKKIRTIIHLGPPGEDDPPDDDDSRPYRDPDEIRVPLRNLSSTTISLP